MKASLLAIITVLVSAKAFASLFGPLPKVTDSWDTIANDRRVVIKQTILAEAFGPKGYFNACVDGQIIRTIEPLKTCVHYVNSNAGGDGGTFRECVAYEDLPVEIALNQTSKTCAEWKTNVSDSGGMTCVRENTIGYVLPTSPAFSIWQLVPAGDGLTSEAPAFILFKKPYLIPSCK
jgi:hypothetical protein